MTAAGSTKKEMGQSEVAKCQVGGCGRGGKIMLNTFVDMDTLHSKVIRKMCKKKSVFTVRVSKT